MNSKDPNDQHAHRALRWCRSHPPDSYPSLTTLAVFRNRSRDEDIELRSEADFFARAPENLRKEAQDAADRPDAAPEQVAHELMRARLKWEKEERVELRNQEKELTVRRRAMQERIENRTATLAELPLKLETLLQVGVALSLVFVCACEGAVGLIYRVRVCVCVDVRAQKEERVELRNQEMELTVSGRAMQDRNTGRAAPQARDPAAGGCAVSLSWCVHMHAKARLVCVGMSCVSCVCCTMYKRVLHRRPRRLLEPRRLWASRPFQPSLDAPSKIIPCPESRLETDTRNRHMKHFLPGTYRRPRERRRLWGSRAACSWRSSSRRNTCPSRSTTST